MLLAPHFFWRWILICALASAPVAGKAKGLVASVGRLPVHAQLNEAGNPEGGFIELLQALGVEMEGGIKVNVYPFKRSINNVINGKADFHLPLIRGHDIREEDLPYQYVDEPITKVAFVLYSMREIPAVGLGLQQLAGLNVATLRGHSHLFSFPIAELNSIESAIKMLAGGRGVDALILEQEATDQLIRQHKMQGVHRQLYRHFDASIIVAKSERGQESASALSSALKKLKQTAGYQEIVRSIHRPYDDWQPASMDW